MNYHEYIILGAGPAGLQMGYFMEQAGRDYLVLEGNASAGSFFQQYPRHGTLISLNKVHNFFPEEEFNLRHDWNSLITHDFSHKFTDYTQELYPKNYILVRYLNDFAKKFNLKIKYNSRIFSISREAEGEKRFMLKSDDGTTYYCKRLLLATGPVKPNIPDVEGIELAEGYEDFDVDPNRYKNKRVVVLGRGNSAFETANDLAGHAALVFIMIGNRLIRHAWNSHFVGDLRSYNNTILDMFQLKALHTVTGTTLTKLVRQENGTLQVHYTEELPHWRTPGTAHGWFEVDHVIRAAGFMYVDSGLFSEEIAPKSDEMNKYPVLDSIWESSTPDMYFIGTNMAARDKKSASGFIHGYRYNVRTLFRLLEEKHHCVPLPSDKFELKDECGLLALGKHLVTRLSMTSALYQLFGTLCDVLVLNDDNTAELFYELPVSYVLRDSDFTKKKIIVLTLELGFDTFENGFEDSLNFVRRNDPQHPANVAYIHPAFRLYENGSYIKGGNTRSSIVSRLDEAADLIDGDLANLKPRNMLLNFINSIVKVTDTVYSEEHFVSDESRGGFTAWASDDPRIKDHGLQRCKVNCDGTPLTIGPLEFK
jgi:thioredoxin reductase